MSEPVKPLFKVKIPGASNLPPGMNRERPRVHVRRGPDGLGASGAFLAFNFDVMIVLVATTYAMSYWSAGHPLESASDLYVHAGIFTAVFAVYFLIGKLIGGTPMRYIFGFNKLLGVIAGVVLSYFLSPFAVEQLKTVAKTASPAVAAESFLRQARAPQFTADTFPIMVLFSDDQARVVFWSGWPSMPFAVQMTKRGNAWVYGGR